MSLVLTSPVFANGGAIPSEYTCDGRDISPPLDWTGAPAGTKSFTLICDDPDAPMGTWVHWVIYDIPSHVNALSKGMLPEPHLPDGTCQGMTDFKRPSYGGPCPPSGTHRYFFRLYALDTLLGIGPNATGKQVTAAMQGYVLDETELMGTYRRQ